MRKSLIALLLPPLLLLVACGDDSEGGEPETSGTATLADVTVEGEYGEPPTLDIPADFTVTDTEVEVLSEGDGETLKQGDTTNVNYLGALGSTGETFDSSFDRGQPLSATLSPSGLIKGFVDGLVGQTVGSRLLIAIPPEDGYGSQGNPQAGITGDDTLVFVVDVISRIPSPDEVPQSAEGRQQPVPPTLPELQLDQQGDPTTFAATPRTDPKADKLQSIVAIEGSGEPVQGGQTLYAHYVGQIYPDGKVFDSSWERGEPASFSIGTGAVIGCWDQGLVGKPVGSRVILVCPPDTAYGPQGNPQAGIKGTDTIIFSVDILGAF